MSEISKLYENAGVNKIGIKRCSGIKQGVCQHNCNECESFDYKYPPFTAEKQLLLLQWLAETRPIHITFLLGKWTIEGMVRYGIKYDTFEDALSGYINQIWEDLSPKEKQQVKGILE